MPADFIARMREDWICLRPAANIAAMSTNKSPSTLLPLESPADWPATHRAALQARRFHDIALAHTDRANPAALLAAQSELAQALAALMTGSCGDCLFWREVADEDGHALGGCRRYPPAYEGWPMTGAGEWCGEFRPR